MKNPSYGIQTEHLFLVALNVAGESNEPAVQGRVPDWLAPAGEQTAGTSCHRTMAQHRSLQLDKSELPMVDYVGGTLWNAIFDGLIAGDAVYVRCPNGLLAFDISDPAAPVTVGKYESPLAYRDCRRFEVAGDLLFGANTNGDCLEVIDIQDPTRPAYVGSTYFRIPMDIIYYEQFVYVADYYHGAIMSFDVSAPTSLVFVDSEGDDPCF